MPDTLTVPEAQTASVPANRLIESAKNVRKSGKARDVEGLAASILVQGLLQNLVVSRHGDDFAVEAGERRRLALRLLVQRGKIPEDWPVPVRIIDEADSTAASATENIQRESMHPADQYEAFSTLVKEGWSLEAIADCFGVTRLVVERRLALAAASPRLLDLLRADKITVEQLVALCATSDHDQQEAVWRDAPMWGREPMNLRRMAVSAEVDATSDPRVAFIGGVEAFTAAGGDVRRDLFSTDGEGGFISDIALLTRLVAEKLDGAADAVRAEGWAWVEVWGAWNHNEYFRLGSVPARRKEVAPEAAAALEALRVEHTTVADEIDEIEAMAQVGYYDEGVEDPEELLEARCARMQEIEAEMARIETEQLAYDPAVLTTSGAVVGIDGGRLRIERGKVRTADRVRAADALGGAGTVSGGRETGVGGPKPRELSDPLTRSLFGYRNLAAQAETAANPQVAKVLLACWAVMTLRHQQNSVPVDIRISDTMIGTRTQHPISDEGGEAKRSLFEKFGTDLAQALPRADHELWDVLMEMPPVELDRLIAFGVGSSVSLSRGHTGLTAKLLTALGFDMAAHFTPTTANYFGRVSKPLIAEAMKEAGKVADETDTTGLMALKKVDLAAKAERSLAASGWVPAIIRTPKAKRTRAARKVPARPAAPATATATGAEARNSRAKAKPTLEDTGSPVAKPPANSKHGRKVKKQPRAGQRAKNPAPKRRGTSRKATRPAATAVEPLRPPVGAAVPEQPDRIAA